MKLKEDLKELDWHVLLLAYLLVGFGVLFIHSATQAGSEFAGQAERQGLFLLPATLVLAFFLLVPYTRFERISFRIYGACLFLLLLLPLAGVSLNNARRWLSVGGILFQPSEFMKLGLVFALARWFRPRSSPDQWQGLVIPGLITLAPMILIVKEPDLSSALVLVPVLFGICYAAGAKGRWLLAVLLVGLLLFGVLYATGSLKSYQVDRIQAWWSQTDMPKEMRLGAGYHLRQSLIAIGSGGIRGEGYMRGLQNVYDFLPYRSTDFIFSVIAEETGFVGSVFFLFLYGLFVFLLLGIAARTRERFGRLLSTGVALLFATELFVHVAVCSGVMPPTGLTLPFISYGRSSLLTHFAALGLVLNVGMRRVRVLTPEGY